MGKLSLGGILIGMDYISSKCIGPLELPEHSSWQGSTVRLLRVLLSDSISVLLSDPFVSSCQIRYKVSCCQIRFRESSYQIRYILLSGPL